MKRETHKQLENEFSIAKQDLTNQLGIVRKNKRTHPRPQPVTWIFPGSSLSSADRDPDALDVDEVVDEMLAKEEEEAMRLLEEAAEALRRSSLPSENDWKKGFG